MSQNTESHEIKPGDKIEFYAPWMPKWTERVPWFLRKRLWVLRTLERKTLFTGVVNADYKPGDYHIGEVHPQGLRKQ